MASYVLCWNSTFVFQFEPAILVNTILETFFCLFSLGVLQWLKALMKSQLFYFVPEIIQNSFLTFISDQEYQNLSILVKSYNSKYYLNNYLSPLLLSEPLLSVNFSV